MKFSGLVIVGCVATAQAGVVGKIAKGIFGRDELEALAHQNNNAVIAGYITKIRTNTIPPGLVNALRAGGCQPPAKARRALDSEFSDTDILLTRAEKTPAQKAAARKAAANPATLPAPIKAALGAAGWQGPCATGGAAPRGNKPRSLDLEYSDFELSARDFDFEEPELFGRDYEYDSDFFYSD